MNLTDFIFTELNEATNFLNFNCGEPEINNFLFEDSKNYQRERMANTFLFTTEDGSVVAYFCISNDCLVDRGQEKGYTNTVFNRLHRKIQLPNDKRIRQYPAVKVGRLGVDIKYHGSGLAYELMLFIKGFTVANNKPACRLLLLDALNKERQLKYYIKNGFEFLLEEDKDAVNRIMYFDLIKIA